MTDPRYERFHSIEDDRQGDRRPPARRDRDRIMYSSAFRRLAGITQVISAADRHPIHNRLTHTLEVAQIGRSIAEELLRTSENIEIANQLGGLDPDVVEAACLAHDLGHPPFGHVAEEELDHLVSNEMGVRDGFEGNPQSFRIVTKMSVRYQTSEGLNLTRATLRAILKYPWIRGNTGKKKRKWGAYESEREEFEFAQQILSGSDRRSLEAELMDWSDDIAYAVHDVEDFYRAGIIPLEKLSTNQRERDRFLSAELELRGADTDWSSNELGEVFNVLMGFSPVTDSYRGDRESRFLLRHFTSSLVDRYVRATSLRLAGDEQPALAIEPKARMEVSILKGLTRYYVIESRALITQRYGHKRLISSLFRTLCQAASSKQHRRVLPLFYGEHLGDSPDDETIVRTVADLISSMTESQVVEMHHRLTGISFGGSLDPIVS